MCTLAVKKEKRKKKLKKLITGGNLTIISLHALHYMKENTTAHLKKRQIARFDHQAASHTPPTHWCVWNTS
jgi:hypothetical protein